MSRIGLLWVGLTLLAPAWAQHRVDPVNRYERIICVVPMVGKGTWEDPRRPMFAPHGLEIGRDKSGILGYYHEPSDDGRSAIVMFVAADRSAFKNILATTDASVKVFDRGKDSQLQVEQALKAVKRDFDIQRFALRVQ